MPSTPDSPARPIRSKRTLWLAVALAAAILSSTVVAPAAFDWDFAPGTRTSIRVRDRAKVDSLARALILERLRAREVLWRDHPAESVDPARVHFSGSASAVVPGLRYWWGGYAPPRSRHMFSEEAVGYAAGEIRALFDLEAWQELVRRTGWTPTTSELALGACAEAVSVAGPRASRQFTPILYRDSETLAALASRELLGTDADELRRTGRLSPAVVTTASEGTWEASYWMIEANQTNYYSCRIGRGDISITTLDSIPGLGIFTSF